MEWKIRKIEKKDNATVENIIRSCLIEFGANHEGTAWMDPDLGRFSEIYDKPRHSYWVAEDEGGRLIGCVGIGLLPGTPEDCDTCELQKMYCIPEARGTGVAHELMETALNFAKENYERCYLETLENMKAAHRFYEKYGFERVGKLLEQSDHFACEISYGRKL